MPIHSCTLPGGKSGYKWGGKGKCYRSRKGAERQAEAAYAHGYKGDAAADGKTGVAAGVLLQRADGRIFLCRRSGTGDHGGEWSLPAGGVEHGEEPQAAAARELREETGWEVDPARLLLQHKDFGDEVDFFTYVLPDADLDNPQLCNEHTAAGWFSREELPNPLHPGLMRTLVHASKVEGALDSASLAMDRDTVRVMDQYGRLHIENTNISKSVINPYYGKEIPRWQELGLQPDRIYYLLRDPVELAKSVATWNRIPLLIKHIGHSSATPVKEWVVGCTGESAAFNPPYLQNSLCIWDGGAIAGVETRKQKELSCSYGYRADMTPGEFEGKRYDGVMRDIVGNHVALVVKGRAGADVVVGDSNPLELPTMKKAGLYAVRTALGQYLRPALAADAAPIPLRELVQPGMSPADVAAATKKHFGSKFSVNTNELADVLTLARDEAEEMEEDEEEAEDEESEEERNKREDKEEEAEREREKRSEDRKKAKDKSAKDRKPAKDKKPARDSKPPAGKEGPRDRSEGRASDEDLIAQGHASAMAGFRAIREAEKAVAPLVGELPAMDSADDVYEAALKQLGVKTAGIHPSAFPALIDAQKQIRAGKSGVRHVTTANDSDTVQKVTDLFPGARKPERA